MLLCPSTSCSRCAPPAFPLPSLPAVFLLVYPYFKVRISAFLDEIPELHMWLLVLTLTQISGQRKDPAAGRSRCCGTLAATSRDCPADTLHRSLATGFRGAAGNPEQPSGDRDHTWHALAHPQARALFSGRKPPCRCVFSNLHLSEPILTSLRDSVLGRTSSHTDVL